MAQKPFHAQTSVITCDMQGIVQEYAADAGELFGWSPAEVVGKLSVATFHLPENVPTLVPRLLKEAVEKGKFEEEVTLRRKDGDVFRARLTVRRSEEHTSELQSRGHLVCRLLLEKKNGYIPKYPLRTRAGL